MRTNSKHVGFWQRFVTWQERSHREIDLNNLSDRSLRDIGLSRSDERFANLAPRSSEAFSENDASPAR
jgi:uncharacterized protein YjiS (DUF1127 family)